LVNYKFIAMKKIIILLSFLLVITSGNAQTPVSGGIYSNTTWTLANSPYIVTDTVVVFPGVTLTIQPGVVVKFNNNMRLEVRQATLIANGTANDSITFTSNSSSPTPGIWSDIFLNYGNSPIQFNYCKFLYAHNGLLVDNPYDLKIRNSRFSRNINGYFILDQMNPAKVDSCSFINNFDYGIRYQTYGTLNFCVFSNNQTGMFVSNTILNNCTINNNQIGIYAAYGQVYIKNCIINSNTNMGVNIFEEYDTITNCQIKFNNIGISTNTGWGESTIIMNTIENNVIGIKSNNAGNQINCNKICNNTSYGFYNNVNIANSISNNYWCSTDSSIIASQIYDGYDNANLGLVTFMPIDTMQCYLTGCNLQVTATVTNATCDTCYNGSATAHVVNGFAPYTYTWYTTPLQTTQTATGLDPGTYTLCVMDANGCTACNYNIYVDSTNCTGFSATAHGANSTCSTCNDGKAWVNINGGTPPFSYSWYTSPMQNTDTAIGLLPGTYGVCITDQYGCAVCDSVLISTGSCSAHFNLYPDSIILHQYYAVNMASGVAPLSYLWQWGDGTTSTGPYPSHTYANAGFYAICLDITDSVGCTSHFCNSYYLQKSTNTMVTITVIPDVAVGMNDNSSDKTISIFPNPSPGLINIAFAGSTKETRVDVINSFGQVVLTKNITNPALTTLDLSNRAKGMYFIKVQNGNGISIKKVIIE
jgi:hypothetical protein